MSDDDVYAEWRQHLTPTLRQKFERKSPEFVQAEIAVYSTAENSDPERSSVPRITKPSTQLRTNGITKRSSPPAYKIGGGEKFLGCRPWVGSGPLVTRHTDGTARSMRPASLPRNGGSSYSEEPGVEIL